MTSLIPPRKTDFFFLFRDLKLEKLKTVNIIEKVKYAIVLRIFFHHLILNSFERLN